MSDKTINRLLVLIYQSRVSLMSAVIGSVLHFRVEMFCRLFLLCPLGAGKSQEKCFQRHAPVSKARHFINLLRCAMQIIPGLAR